MKNKIVIIFISVLFFSTGAYAQFTQFGAKAGVNFSNMTIDDSSDKTLKTGFHAGVFGRMGLTESFSLQPELLYTTKGLTNTYDNALAEGEAKFNLNYIEIPINFVYHLAEDFSFQLGPYVGYLLNANVSTSNSLLDFFDIDTNDNIDRDNFKSFDLGLTAGLDFTLDPVILGFKYNLGLVNVGKDNVVSEQLLGDARNTVIQIYAGILF